LGCFGRRMASCSCGMFFSPGSDCIGGCLEPTPSSPVPCLLLTACPPANQQSSLPSQRLMHRGGLFPRSWGSIQLRRAMFTWISFLTWQRSRGPRMHYIDPCVRRYGRARAGGGARGRSLAWEICTSPRQAPEKVAWRRRWAPSTAGEHRWRERGEPNRLSLLGLAGSRAR
jgi:hypothetical protein